MSKARANIPTGRKATLSERAHQAIKSEILRGEVEEGTFLSEMEVRRKHKIGRTPFREACNRLHHEGILQVIPRRGYFVPEISFRDVREMFEARLALEGTIAEIAAAHARPAQIEEMERLVRLSPSSGDSDDEFQALVKGNTEFHLCLARMTQNRELVRVVTSILERNERLAYLQLRTARWRSKDIQLLHKPILEAIRKRDRAAAREAVGRDIRSRQTEIFGPNAWSVDHSKPPVGAYAAQRGGRPSGGRGERDGAK